VLKHQKIIIIFKIFISLSKQDKSGLLYTDCLAHLLIYVTILNSILQSLDLESENQVNSEIQDKKSNEYKDEKSENMSEQSLNPEAEGINSVLNTELESKQIKDTSIKELQSLDDQCESGQQNQRQILPGDNVKNEDRIECDSSDNTQEKNDQISNSMNKCASNVDKPICGSSNSSADNDDRQKTSFKENVTEHSNTMSAETTCVVQSDNKTLDESKQNDELGLQNEPTQSESSQSNKNNLNCDTQNVPVEQDSFNGQIQMQEQVTLNSQLKKQVTLTSQLKEQEQVTLTEQIPSHEQDALNTQILEQDKDSSNTQIQNKEIKNDAAEDNEINGKKKEASFEDSLVSDLNTVEKDKTCENETLLQTENQTEINVKEESVNQSESPINVSRPQDSLLRYLDAIENNAKCLKNESEHVPQREINNKESEMEIEDYDQVESVNEIEGQIDASSIKEGQFDSSDDEDSKQNEDFNNGQQSSNGRAGIEYDNLSCDISEDSSSGMISENKINGIETDMPMDLISESSCSEYPSLDTPGPPTPMSSTVETGSNSMGPTQSKRSRLGSSGNSAADVKSSYKQ
jgi:hypothetical protein